MRRFIVVIVLLTLAGVGLPGGQPSIASAQEGVTVEVLGRGTPPEAGGQQLTLLRATFAPDGFVAPHRHPGPMLLYIESGALAFSVIEGTVEVVRAPIAGAAAPAETLGAGSETILRPGDQLLERGVVHAARNAATDPTVVLVSALLAPGQPVTQLVDSARQP